MMEFPSKVRALPIDERLFAPGDTVVWGGDLAEDSAHPRKRAGEGPFIIHEVFPVPMACTMAGTYCRHGDHHPECGISVAQGVGHPQWVKVLLPDGTVLQDAEGTGESRLSGAWFVRA